ncbi:MAG: NfeD family protein [Thiothrix sp.]|nr:NfeD family protein [Thiothrix sp.]HPQ93983.1 NfeD family protein [Thiolinea sp.]
MAATNQQQPQQAEGLGRISKALSDFGERARSGELKARLQYFLFRQSQQARRSDSLLSKYKRRLQEDWAKWLGIAAGLTALVMFLSPDSFWFWQIPLVLLLTILAPFFFELPNTLNALFGNTEQQHLVGSIITLTHPIVDGQGQTHLEGRDWQVSGPDCVAGSSVKIVTLDARTLYVTLVGQDAHNFGNH